MKIGDLIRQMTDEELIDNGFIECPNIYRNCSKKSCYECKMEYLNMEAEEEK